MRILSTIIASLCVLCSCNGTAQSGEKTNTDTVPGKEQAKTDKAQSGDQTNTDKTMKSIVIYFSRSGNNYVNGDIIDLPVGNTKVVAQRIQEQTGCEAFEIIPEKTYPSDYEECTKVAQQELNAQARPAYKGDVDLKDYEVVYLGYPIWWGTYPRCVATFLEKHGGLEGKTVLPFSTHEGSGLGSSVEELKKACPKATVKAGAAIKGSDAKTADINPIINQ